MALIKSFLFCFQIDSSSFTFQQTIHSFKKKKITGDKSRSRNLPLERHRPLDQDPDFSEGDLRKDASHRKTPQHEGAEEQNTC